MGEELYPGTGTHEDGDDTRKPRKGGRTLKRGGDVFMMRALHGFSEKGIHEITISNTPRVKQYIATIKTCGKKTRDTTSLSFLVKHDMSQSACIRLGNELEEILNLFIQALIQKTYARSGDKKNTRGKRQKDILFLNETDKIAIYAELKSNINLDTEKYKATVQKVQAVEKELEEKGYVVKAYLVSLRYLETMDIPRTSAQKYKDVKLVGLRDFIEMIIPVERIKELASYDEYSTFLDKLALQLECA